MPFFGGTQVDVKKAALEYAAKGWPVFPCKADKSPYTDHGFMDASTDPKTIEEWWAKWPRANIGFEPGAVNMMVLDLDPGHSMKELEENVGPVPKTNLSARTPRGGIHLYLGISPDSHVAPSASKLAPYVDVRSFHSYVLLPPSRTDDGVYTWDGDGKPAFRTDEIFRLANSAKEKSEHSDTWIIKPDLPENVDKANYWLANEAKPGIKGHGGNHCTYATAAMCKSYGLSESMAFDMLWEHWCPRCTPPWDEGGIAELERTIHNAYGYNTSDPGNMTQAYKVAKTAQMFTAVEVDEGLSGLEFKNGRFRLVDRERMEHIQPPEWLIKDFLVEGSYAMLFGARGTFKTFLALDIALSIATGFPVEPVWPGIVTPGPVLFAAGEGRPQLLKRVTAWEQVHYGGDRVADFTLIDPVVNVAEAWEPFIDLAKAKHSRYKLIVLDTVGRAMQGINENAQEHASKFTALVQRLQIELGATVLALHHTGHDKKERSRGSSVFGADLDTEIRLDREGEAYTIALEMTKQKDDETWKQPKLITLQETILSPKQKSLVAVKASEQAIQRTAAASKAKSEMDSAVLDIIEQAVIKVLSKNKTRAYSNTGLAKIVACDERINLGNSQIRQNYLTNLREDSERTVCRYYDAYTEKWRMTEFDFKADSAK